MGKDQRCTVLVVEDDPSIAEFVEAALSDEGWEVRVTPSGEEGLQQTALEKPALILLDMILPGMSGSTFLSELRQAHGSEIPVVLMTAAREQPEPGLEADGLLLKPFELNTLLNEVERVAAGRCKRPA